MSISATYATPLQQHSTHLPTRAPVTPVPQAGSGTTASPHETALLNAYIAALQRKVLHDDAGLVKVPPQSVLGQWLELYRAQVEHPVVQGWMREQEIDPSALLSIDPFKGTLTVGAGAQTKTFSLSDTSGWDQVSGPLLDAAKVIAPENKGALRVRFGDGDTQVSAKVVANFQGIALPASRSKATDQIRHLEQQKAFDPIPADDRVRPASSRSAGALEVHKKNAATFYSSAPQTLEYKHLAVDVATNLPDTRAEAKKWAEALIFKLTGKHVDADTLYFNRFDNYNTPLNGATASGAEHLNDEPKSSLRLPDALLKNFSEHDGIPGELDTHAGLYTVGYGAGATGGYGARNEFPLAPSKLMHESWKTDFQGQMDKKIDKFWSTHTENYEVAIKGEFTYQARKQLKAAEAKPAAEQAVQAPEHRFTRDDYRLVMGAVSNLPLDENAPLSVEQLKTKAPVNDVVKAYVLNIHGITSSDIVRFSAHDGSRQVIYIPGAVPAFLRFDSLEQLNKWITNQANDPKKREALAAHFPLASRQDHTHKPGVGESILEGLIPGLALVTSAAKSKGLDTVLSEMADGSLKGPAVSASHSKIEGDVFSTLASASKVRMSSDADIVIKSNSEVIRDTWLNDITVAAGLLVKLAPIAAPVAAVSLITSLAEVGLGTEKASSGDTEAERKDGASKAFDGVLNVLFSAGASATPEDPFAAPAEQPLPPAEPSPKPEAPAVEEPQPGTSTGSQTIDSPAQSPLPNSPSLIPMAQYAVPEGEALISNAVRDASGVYRLTDANGIFRQFVRVTDETGKSGIFEISGRYRSGDSFARIINPNTGAGLMVVTPGRDGEWARAPGDGGKWWSRTPSPTPSNGSGTVVRFTQQFVESDGSRISGAEKFDNYLNFNPDKDYLLSSKFYEENGTLKRKLNTSWTVDDGNFSVTEGESAQKSPYSESEYSSSFAPDLKREHYTVVTKDPAGDVKTELSYKSEDEEDTLKHRLEKFEAAIPDAALRARISEVAHQGASFPAFIELTPPTLKEGFSVKASDKFYTITYDPKGEVQTVTAVTQWKLRMEMEDDLATTRDLDVSSTRTFKIRMSNELDSDGYTIDKSAPTKIEISTSVII